MFKVIIAGGRDFKNYALLEFKCNHFLKNKSRDDIQIISGCAYGADQLAIDYAENNDIHVKEFPANWDKYGKSAGYIRNSEMGEYADALIAFWDGESRGTKNMIEVMKNLGKPVRVVEYKKRK